MTIAPKIILSIVDMDERAVEEKARQVGADILQQYRQLASRLRQQAWQEIAAIGASQDPTKRASSHSAFQLYTTAASELDEIIADLSERPSHLESDAAQPPVVLIDCGVGEDIPRIGRRPV